MQDNFFTHRFLGGAVGDVLVLVHGAASATQNGHPTVRSHSSGVGLRRADSQTASSLSTS